MTTVKLQQQAPWTPAAIMRTCRDVTLHTRASLLAYLPPANEPHVTLNRARREFPEVFNPEISAALQEWQRNRQPTEAEANAALATVWDTPHTAVRIGVMAMTGNAPKKPAGVRPTVTPPPEAEPKPYPRRQRPCSGWHSTMTPNRRHSARHGPRTEQPSRNASRFPILVLSWKREASWTSS